jgi:hypothetical protein
MKKQVTPLNEQISLARMIVRFLGKPAWDYCVAWPDTPDHPYAKIFVQWEQGEEWHLHGEMRIELVDREYKGELK